MVSLGGEIGCGTDVIGADCGGGLHDDCHHRVLPTVTENCPSELRSYRILSISD